MGERDVITTTSNDAVTEDYLTWATSSKISFPKVTQAYFDELRGMKAVQKIVPDELFVTVPRSAALVVEPKGKCPCPEFTSPSYWKEAPWYIKMSILLLKEKKRKNPRDSPVWGYILQLPSSIDTPLRWTDQELQELQYEPLLNAVYQQRTQWKQHYGRFIEASRGLEGASVSWDEYLWATENVRSRAFSGPYAGAPLDERLRLAGAVAVAGMVYVAWARLPLEQALNGAIAAAVFNLLYDVLLSSRLKWFAMCPVIDALNHNSKVESTIEFEYFQDTFVTSTKRGYAPGEQVFISYGKQTNDSLFQYYGFTEKGNPNDTIVVEGTSNENKESGKEMRLVVTSKGSLTQESLKIAKEFVADDTKQSSVQSFIASMVERELRKMPTSIAEDEKLLSTPHLLSSRKRSAIEFRLEKKRLMKKAVDYAKKKASKND